ncbi:MAG: CBS domain-containing protein [Actinomycetota bacterium]|nr:CBS domain-containing protein [Actinomycetota bacterium]
MSPRAACRLESLRFSAVYDYAAGKTDWTGSGFPTEGSHADIPRPGHLARPTPTCRLSDTVATARERARDAGVCIVISDDGIVLGRLRGRAFEQDGASSVVDVMEPGPTTVRYDEFLPNLVERMRKGGVGSIVVTKPSGALVGVMQRSDAEEFLAELHQDHHDHDGS